MDQDTEGYTIDLDRPERTVVGATRGEIEVDVGPPQDEPDHAEVTVRHATDGSGDVVVSIDATAGDHGMGHADVTLSDAEVRELRAALEELGR